MRNLILWLIYCIALKHWLIDAALSSYHEKATMRYALHESTPAWSWPFSKLSDKITWDFDEIFADRKAEK